MTTSNSISVNALFSLINVSKILDVINLLSVSYLSLTETLLNE